MLSSFFLFCNYCGNSDGFAVPPEAEVTALLLFVRGAYISIGSQTFYFTCTSDTQKEDTIIYLETPR